MLTIPGLSQSRNLRTSFLWVTRGRYSGWNGRLKYYPFEKQFGKSIRIKLFVRFAKFRLFPRVVTKTWIEDST